MKIYVIGSASSGKTTLARYISQKYNLPLLPEVARLILAEKELQIDSLRSNLEIVNSYQKEIFYRQLEEENKTKDNFVSDRSLDCLAYAAQFATVTEELFQAQELKDYIGSLKKPDVFLFFVRPSKTLLKQDGVRETLEWESVVRIDGAIKFLLSMFGLRHFQIDSINMQERSILIDSILSLHYLKN